MRGAVAGAMLLAAMSVAAAPYRTPEPHRHAGRHSPPSIAEIERARAATLAAQRDAQARAATAQAAERRLSEARVAAAALLRGSERRTAELADQMDALARRRADAERALEARASALAPLLPLIERLSLYPAETLLAVPASRDTALRGILVLQGITAELERQAAGLRQEQAEIAGIQAQIAAETPKLRVAQTTQAEQEAALDRQIAAARQAGSAAQAEVTASAQQEAAEAAQADTLRAAIARVDAERQAALARAKTDAERAERERRPRVAAAALLRQQALAQPSGPDTLAAAAAPVGQLTQPVVGTLVHAWGQDTDAGPADGVSYRAAPGARVVSPCGGRAVFAAPFRSYGLLLIVDCGGGYHMVLGGLDRLDVRAGASLRSGEPVGVMPAWDPTHPGPRPSLYVELRRGGVALNPAPWLRGRG